MEGARSISSDGTYYCKILVVMLLLFGVGGGAIERVLTYVLSREISLAKVVGVRRFKF